MNKIILILFSILVPKLIVAQEKEKKDYGKLTGGFETNSQWYVNDNKLQSLQFNPIQPEDPIRSNNYLNLNYSYKNWSAGIQAESYEPNALLNLNPELKGTNIGTYYLRYKTNKLDATFGYFYEQFGSGLIFRSREERALGINTALRGAKINYTPFDFLTVTALAGQQRNGFKLADSNSLGYNLNDMMKIFGFNTEIGVSKMAKIEDFDISMGFSYIARNQEIKIANPNFEPITSAFSGRLNVSYNTFYFSTEYDYKTEDAIVSLNPVALDNNFVKPGNALLVNLGYSQPGFGIDGTFRRLENMSFFSERTAFGNTFNAKWMNFVPSLTKQHHSNLANIYVYAAQPQVSMQTPSLLKSGEIGFQIDAFAKFKKGSIIGGETGTKIEFNISRWYGLKGKYKFYNPNNDYQNDFLNLGNKYFTDINLGIDKKINNQLHTHLTYINQFYSKRYIEEAVGDINIHIVTAEAVYKVFNNKSISLLLEHLWADYERKNWAGGTLEFSVNNKLSFFSSDSFNYGNNDPNRRIHYYSVGSAFRHKSSRLAVSYGRQRGGLVCVGGVCRVVPESTGLSLTFNTSF